ncbi:uncharacterized protein TNCV_1189771 [Trichonephila clavipes]|nr:uncharacterized protein TNCV_1189771 [Trichonephila clavipes]
MLEQSSGISAGSMKSVGAYRLFECPRETRKLEYVAVYGDGDSKSHLAVKDNYGIDSERKYECIGHIQKRVGSKLRILKTKEKDLEFFKKSSPNVVGYLKDFVSLREIGQRVGRNQTTEMQICHLWMQEETTDHRSLPHPSHCTTARDVRRIVHMTMMDTHPRYES